MPANAQSDDHAAYRRAKRRTLIQWLALALALALLGAAIGTNLYLDYGHTEARERDRLSTQAQIIAQNIEVQLATANRTLEGLLGDLSVWKDAYDRQTHLEYIKAISGATPGIRSIGIVDADGTLLASNDAGNLGDNFSYQSYFQTAKWQPNGQTLYISAPYQSLLSSSALNMARASLGQHGEFQGVVYATLDGDYFKTLMASVLYAPDMWDAAIHADGFMFLSVPKRDEFAGINLAQAGTFFSRHMASGKAATVLTGKALISSKSQIVAQQTVQPARLHMNKPLIIAVGRNLDAVFYSWKNSAALQGGLFLLIAMVTIFGLYAYQRREREFDRKEALVGTALRASEENYRLIIENTRDVVVKLNAKGLYTYVNPAFSTLYGMNLEALRGKYYWNHVILEDRHLAYEFFEQLSHAPYTAGANLRENTLEGVRYLDWTGQAVSDDHGNITGIISIGRDVTQHVQRMARLEEQAQQDSLTNLANRRHFMNMGNAEFARAHRYRRQLSLLALDVDHFKKINDTYGHQAGDIVLQRFSAILLDALRDVDIAGRMGGEEFAILLPETNMQAALQMAYRLHEAIGRCEVVLKSGAAVKFTASIGVATLDDDTATLDTLLDRADMALYKAKQSGRNRVCTVDMRAAI